MRPWIAVSGGLIAAGVALFLYKTLILGYPLSTAEVPGTWRVDFVVTVTGKGSRTVVDIPLPRSSGYQRLLTEEVKSDQMRFSIAEAEGDRRGRWSGRLDGSAGLTYQVTFDATPYGRPLPAADAGGKYPKSVAVYLQSSAGVQHGDPVIAELSRELVLDGKDKARLAQAIFDFVAREIGPLSTTAPMDAVTVVREGRGNDLGRARLFCALARFNGLPCRVMAGIPLSTGRQDQFQYWNEVYLAGGWTPFDAVARQAGTLPPDRLSLGPSNGAQLVDASNISALSYRFDVQSELETYTELVRRRLANSQHPLDKISLLFLPVEVQHVLRILLLVPLGALSMCVLRNMVGLRTFGMFMPVLIALAFTGTGLTWGTVFLIVLISFALLSRMLIERLYLLLAARIAFILTLVVLLMVALFVIGDKLGMPTSGVGAFPFVIMTMIVERISVGLEEEGLGNTLRRIGATLASIYLTYAVIHARGLQTLFLVYPELLLIILGLLVAVGRYTGYRLAELVRFRELADAPQPMPAALSARMRRFFARARNLRERGVLGINQRNGVLVLPLNPRRHYPRVDDKLLTKQLALAAGIPTPRSLGVISFHHQLRDLPALLADRHQFVLKPARGSQGNGIVVIVGVEDGRYRKSSGALLDGAHLRQHVSSTLSGVFSLRGDADSCIIEERIILHPAFRDIAKFGVPDIRVVVYRGVPVMAMCRLPTVASDGRANLHQGAIGVGLDIASGTALHAAFHNASVTHHVDTHAPIVGFVVPRWDELLALAVRAADISGLGYLGVDVIVDEAHGPLLLELNARPGLAIQVANNAGLLPRLRRTDALPVRDLSEWTRRLAIARELFSASPA